jgi:hypothetical protein
MEDAIKTMLESMDKRLSRDELAQSIKIARIDEALVPEFRGLFKESKSAPPQLTYPGVLEEPTGD